MRTNSPNGDASVGFEFMIKQLATNSNNPHKSDLPVMFVCVGRLL